MNQFRKLSNGVQQVRNDPLKLYQHPNCWRFLTWAICGAIFAGIILLITYISLYLGGSKMSWSIHFNTLEYRFKTLQVSPWRKQSESTTPQMDDELQNSHNFL
ncbi:Hypothetical_protein [Hexamita inflata]|uniref:Hypothetical_protein n=1 Tax=Hexamita inflata TaxID=28002 RepID=A0ABP1HE81_9EUKA